MPVELHTNLICQYVSLEVSLLFTDFVSESFTHALSTTDLLSCCWTYEFLKFLAIRNKTAMKFLVRGF